MYEIAFDTAFDTALTRNYRLTVDAVIIRSRVMLYKNYRKGKK